MILGSYRICQQLREYNYNQFGISSFYNKHCCFHYKKKSQISSSCSFILPPTFSPRFAFCSSSSKRIFGLNVNSRCSSSPVTNNNEDPSGVSLLSSGKFVPCSPRVSDCLSLAEDGQYPASERLSPVAGGVVALGKFDALHIGHRKLAVQAAKIGVPFLLSFIGMAEILGWEPRPPIVAKCDRKRVLSSWAPLCSNVTPKEFQVDFSKVRYLTPQQFVEKLSHELGVRGVVAGENYRFGYKAAGDASDLLRLCEEYGMGAYIINSVMDKNQESKDIGGNNSKERGQVSSTRVRHALANGDMKYVSQLLGRHHRLILDVKNNETGFKDRNRLSADRSCLLNLPPKDGCYENCCVLTDEDESVVPCRVVIDAREVHVELYQSESDDPRLNLAAQSLELLSIEFFDSIL